MYANNLDDAFLAFTLGETEEWVKSDKYMDYPEYQDEEYTYIEGRTIGDITAQISVQGESYSQYISFMIDRYYDGIDLTGMSIWIHYELKDGSGSEDSPVNVEYNSNAIRFGWIIPEKATQQSGDIKIGVWVNGTAPNTKPYILKTKEKIYTIHQGLIPGSGITQPDQNWFENFVVQIDSKVSTAQGYANDAQASKTAAAGSAAESAQSAAESAQALEDNRAYVESQKETFVGYNKRETDLKYANALIGTASGMGRVTVGDAWEAPVTDLEVSGRSEQMVTTGAQLLDCSKLNKSAGGAVVNHGDGGYSISGTGALTASFTASYTLDIKNVLKPGNLIIKSQLTMPKLYIRIWDGSNVLVEMQGNSTKQITQDMIDNENVRVECFFHGNAGSTITPGTYHPMLYQSGDGTWEPYTGGKPSPSPEYPQEIVSTDVTAVTVTGANNQSKTASITLTEPLRGIGDVRDRIMRRDGVWGVERQFVSLSFNGSENWEKGGTVTSNQFRLALSDYIGVIKNEENSNKPIKIMCDRLKAGSSSNTYSRIECISSNTSGYILVYLDDFSSGDVSAFETYLSTHPITAIFERATPTWEPLPSAAQSALNALTTYTGTTHVTITAGGPEPDVGLEYVQDTNVIIAGLKKLIEGLINA